VTEPGTAFGFLGVRIVGSEIWSHGRSTRIRRLGPLRGARAGTSGPARTVAAGIPVTTAGLTSSLQVAGTIFVDFADGSRYERALRPLAVPDLRKIEAEIDACNSLADAAD